MCENGPKILEKSLRLPAGIAARANSPLVNLVHSCYYSIITANYGLCPAGHARGKFIARLSMPNMTWKDEYSVGDTTLDDHHRDLVQLVNRLDDGAPLAAVLDEICHFAEVHFSAEEDRLEKSGYPDLVRHRTQHKAFRAWLDMALHQHRTNDGCCATREDISAYLRVWIANHVLVYDRAFMSWLN